MTFKAAPVVFTDDTVEAVRILGPEAIRAAAAVALRAAHPDTADIAAEGDVGKRIADIRAARDHLLSLCEPVDNSVHSACQWCGGRGSFATRFGAQPCAHCYGRGVITL